MTTHPKSPKEMTGGMMYFPRILDKIRLHAQAELHEDYHKNLGAPRTLDGACCNFLRVNYADLCERVKQGGTDEEILEWCFERGHRLNEGDLFVWNAFASKLGWRDSFTPLLEQRGNRVSKRKVVAAFCHVERHETSLVIWLDEPVGEEPEILRFAQNDRTQGAICQEDGRVRLAIRSN